MPTRLSLRSVRRAILALLSTTIVAQTFCARPLLAQRQPTAGLLKRLAEAVDGQRTGASVFVVASYVAPYTVQGVYQNRSDAAAAAARDGANLGIFGPYQTTADVPNRNIVFFTDCVHLDPSVLKFCPDEHRPLLLRDIASLTLTIRLTSGAAKTVEIPTNADAMFFTVAALDKFAFPYYARLQGVEAAAEMRRKALGAAPVPNP